MLCWTHNKFQNKKKIVIKVVVVIKTIKNIIYLFIQLLERRVVTGWDNFQMIEIKKFDCEDGNEAKARKRYWIEELKSDLNSSIPTRT